MLWCDWLMKQMRYLNLRFLIGRIEDYGDDLACSPTSGYGWQWCGPSQPLATVTSHKAWLSNSSFQY